MTNGVRRAGQARETIVPAFLLSYRVPNDYQPRAETRQAWQAWFESLGSYRADTGHGVLATRTLGRLDAQTRLGGYSVVTAEDMEGAAALAAGCPALQLGGGVEIGAVPEFIENLRPGTDA
jgi:YCII-related domain